MFETKRNCSNNPNNDRQALRVDFIHLHLQLQLQLRRWQNQKLSLCGPDIILKTIFFVCDPRSSLNTFLRTKNKISTLGWGRLWSDQSAKLITKLNFLGLPIFAKISFKIIFINTCSDECTRILLWYSTKICHQVMWWDTRKLSEPTEVLVLDLTKNDSDFPEWTRWARSHGVSCMDYDPSIPIRFMVRTQSFLFYFRLKNVIRVFFRTFYSLSLLLKFKTHNIITYS